MRGRVGTSLSEGGQEKQQPENGCVPRGLSPLSPRNPTPPQQGGGEAASETQGKSPTPHPRERRGGETPGLQRGNDAFQGGQTSKGTLSNQPSAKAQNVSQGPQWL